MISFLWLTYGTRGINFEPAGIAATQDKAERCVRRAFAADETITGAVIREVKLTASPDNQLFEWQPVRVGLIFARDAERAVRTMPIAKTCAAAGTPAYQDNRPGRSPAPRS